MVPMSTCRVPQAARGNARRGLTAAAILTLIAALPGWAAAPANFKFVDVGTVGAAGSVDFNATTNVMTVKGAGDMQDTTNADGFFFVYQEVAGDGAIIARVVSQNTSQGQPKTG